MKYKRKPLPIADGALLIELLEQEVSAGNASLIAANLPTLKRYVKLYQDRIYLNNIGSRVKFCHGFICEWE